jgi:hypothetical protein
VLSPYRPASRCSSQRSPIPRTWGPGRLRAGAAKADFTPREADLPIATDSIRDLPFAKTSAVVLPSPIATVRGIDRVLSEL